MDSEFTAWVERARAVSIADMVAKRGGLGLNKKLVGPCPKCGGTDRFAINSVKGVFNCRQCGAKGDVIALAQFLDDCDFLRACETLTGESPPEDKRPKEKRKKPNGSGGAQLGPIVAIYPYTDESETLLFEVLRYEVPEKTFRQRRPDGNGGWIKNLDGVRRVLYRLPRLIEGIASGQTVVVVEGERDVETAERIGLVATTNVGGAGKGWLAEYDTHFDGADVVIIPDQDEPGWRRANSIGEHLSRRAARVRVLILPEHDLTDWVTSGGTRERLDELIDGAPAWVPPIEEAPAPEVALEADKPQPLPNIILTLQEWLTRELPEPDYLLGSWLATTSRALLVAPTGLGKTMLGIAVGIRVAAKRNFLKWKAARPARVLFVDGEMSRRLLKQRLVEEAARLGIEIEPPGSMNILSHEDFEVFPPLNTPEGQAVIESAIERIGGVDLIIFDNIMSLVGGNMREEEDWRQTIPWILSLTRRRIGQIWVHHMGHDETRTYGTKTREWMMDTVIHMERIERADTDVSFQLVFKKARERTPETREHDRLVQSVQAVV